MPILNTKKRTIQDVLDHFHEVHGDVYDYSLFKEYKNGNTKIKIICKIHGVFEQIPRSHYSGTGCPMCGCGKSSDKSRRSLEDFIKKAKEKYGDRFTYDKTVYKNSGEPVIISCRTHGDFSTKPRTFLGENSKHGCKKCYWDSKKLSAEDFIKKAKSKHGDRYDYSLINTLNTVVSKDKVRIVCKEHGVYETTAAIHLSGFNCKECQKQNALGGYSYEYFEKFPERRYRRGVLYLVKFSNDENCFIKIGISVTFDTRFIGSEYSKFKKEILFLKETSIYHAFLEEQRILSLGCKKYIPVGDFRGKYECFSVDEETYLTEAINGT